MKSNKAAMVLAQIIVVAAFVGLLAFIPMRQITNAMPQWTFANPQVLGRLKLAWMAFGASSTIAALAFTWLRKTRGQSAML